MIRLGLIGYPLGHSLSPMIHTAALDTCNLRGEYNLFPVPQENIQEIRLLLERLRADEITGLNVTIPHKQTIIPLLDELTETAQNIGAVNTIFKKNNNLIGDNTDVSGFSSHLRRSFGTCKEIPKTEKKALVLGAGGAARAITYSLLQDGWQVILAARRLEQAQSLIDQFPKFRAELNAILLQADSLRTFENDLHLVINTTPVGMYPNLEYSPWPEDVPYPPQAVIYDIVYNPKETIFIIDARAGGLRTISGIGMLVEQAALAFEIWTGRNVPREPLFAAVEEK